MGIMRFSYTKETPKAPQMPVCLASCRLFTMLERVLDVAASRG